MKAKFLRIGSSVGILALLISGNFLLFPKASHASSVCQQSMSSSSASASSASSEKESRRIQLQKLLERTQARKDFLECRLNNDPLTKDRERPSLEKKLDNVNKWIAYYNKQLAKL